jgi:hypothetical protein
MSSLPSVARDERTVAVENASYRWSYLFLSFGLLVATAYRSFGRDETPWDLLLLVILGGLVGTLYQGYHRILGRGWAAAAFVSLLVAGVVAALLVWFRS